MAKKLNDSHFDVSTVAALNTLLERVRLAQKEYSSFSQEKVDEIFYEAAMAANQERIPLAKLAVEETGMGIVEDKVIKNHFASEFIYNKFRRAKTCGIIEHDESAGIYRIGEPLGVIAAVIPTTNPTSTAIFKALIALKTRNAIVISPHPRATKCTIAATKIVLEAAVRAGAPKDILGWISTPSLELTNALMSHADIAMILATGGPGLVKAAYSSGKPAVGVGAGNTPVLIDETADIRTAVNSVLISKTFDNGMVCASEQALVVHKDNYEAVKLELVLRGAHILNRAEYIKVSKVLLDPEKGSLNAAIVGQTAYNIAKMAGLDVAPATKVLVAEVSRIGKEEAFSHEKLSPNLALYKCENFEDGLKKAKALVEFGGIGHTSVFYTNRNNSARITKFGDIMKTGRILINTPASHGAIGDIYNFKLNPSLTLGCGSWGGNAVSENVGVVHLLNIKTIAERRENMLWFQLPPKIYHKLGCLREALKDLIGKKRVLLITDVYLMSSGLASKIIDILTEYGIEWQCYSKVQPDPTLSTISEALSVANDFQPDTIIGFGGGSPMDAAKIVWLLYENPNISFAGISMRFMDIRKRIYDINNARAKASFVAIPTTSGTGSEVTPFSVVTDDETGKKYPLADYALTPDMAIVDAELVLDMPKSLTAASGMDAITHALEAIASCLATDMTTPLAMEAARILFKYLPIAVAEGGKNQKAREKVHTASTMAGMSFANAFLGVCHSMAHKLGARFHIAHGVANGIMINQTVLFNATENPVKQAAFSQYTHPNIVARYSRLANYIGIGSKDSKDNIGRLVGELDKIKKTINLPLSIKETGVNEKEFLACVDSLAEEAFDDQCTGANPRYPMIAEIKQMYINAYYGKNTAV